MLEKWYYCLGNNDQKSHASFASCSEMLDIECVCVCACSLFHKLKVS